MASKRKQIRRDDLTKATKGLEEMLILDPEPKLVVTAGEAIRELAPLLRKLRRKGHSTTRISKTLEKFGVAIGSSTLNSYLRRSTVPRAKDSHGAIEPATSAPSPLQEGSCVPAIDGAAKKPASEKPNKTTEESQSQQNNSSFVLRTNAQKAKG